VQNWETKLRDMFIPEPGNVFVACDEAQLELRMIAGLARCVYYLDTFNAPASAPKEQRDPHYRLCIDTYGDRFLSAPSAGQKKIRRTIKELTYGSGYGAENETKHEILTSVEDEETEQLMFPDITLREVATFTDKWHERCPEIRLWWESLVLEFRRQRYLTEPVMGLRCDFLDGEEPTKLYAYKPQCVPGFTRVLTDRGYVPISEIVGQRFKAWTGQRWAPATAIRKGDAPVWAVRTDRGVTLHADASHELLVPIRSRYAWRRVDRLKATDSSRVALDLARPLEFGAKEDPEEAWVLGFWIAEGSASTESERDVALKFSQNGDGKLRRVAQWARRKGLDVSWDRGRKCHSLTVYVGGTLWLRSWGADSTWRSATKRVPERIWRADLASRKAFLTGFLDGDGYLNDRAGRVIVRICQRRLLEELWILFRTVGVDSSRIDGPQITDRQGHVAYCLHLCAALAWKHLHWGRAAKLRTTRSGQAPWWFVKANASALRPASPSDVSTKGKARCGKFSTSPYVLQRMGVEGYDHARVTGHMSRRVIVPLYTLCVDDPEHSYVAEGFISHNSGGSALVHLATFRMLDAIPFEKWGRGTGLIHQGHDSLVVECPAAEGERVAKLLEECMKEDGRKFGLDLPFIGESKVGRNLKEV
jgi:hypothetical protein